MEATKEKWVAYYRVSTRRQSLGLDAQRAKILTASNANGATIIEEIEEKESGTERERPGLNRALALARKHKAKLVVAKHDRLSRDITYASELIFHSGIKFKVLNLMDEALTDPLLFGVYWGLADKEARMISERTKEALAKLKSNGVKLGNPNGAKVLLNDENKKASRQGRIKKADEATNNVSSANEIKRYLNSGGKNTLQAIANHLTESGYYTSRGVFHTPMSVKLLCQRYGIER